MALFAFLLSQLGRKLNDIVQAVFGWSVTALFGKLQRRAQVLITVALILSLVWPVFVVGVFAPGVSSWALALVPFHHWFSDAALRIVWSALAVAAPLGVGLLIHLAVGGRRVLTSALHGYQLALGFFAAFLVVVITVPIVKVASLIRRWSDEHVYMQAHQHAYDDMLQCLVEACEDAGLQPEVSDAPRSMVLATTIMRALARGAVAPFVTEKLRRVTADGIELYLYPGDLMLRGNPFIVGRVRANLTRTHLDAYAYLVDSDKAKPIQDVLAKLSRDVEEAIDHHAPGPTARGAAGRGVSHHEGHPGQLPRVVRAGRARAQARAPHDRGRPGRGERAAARRRCRAHAAAPRAAEAGQRPPRRRGVRVRPGRRFAPRHGHAHRRAPAAAALIPSRP